MQTFTRDDGRVLDVVPGYRERVLADRRSFSPRRTWSDDDYAAAARQKRQRTTRLIDQFIGYGGRVEGADVLDVGCGDGINCMLIALHPVRSVVGIDRELPLLTSVERSERVRRLAEEVARQAGLDGDLDGFLGQLPLRLLTMDATAMALPTESFDFVISRSAIEHIQPVEEALGEIARVVRPGGLIHLSTDPYFSPRGCHKGGVVDIPVAHARLSIAEFERFVTMREGPARARRRVERLQSLNPLTIAEWRQKVEALPVDILAWEEHRSPFAESVLEEYPDVIETLRDGIERRDVTHDRLRMWLRRR